MRSFTPLLLLPAIPGCLGRPTSNATALRWQLFTPWVEPSVIMAQCKAIYAPTDLDPACDFSSALSDANKKFADIGPQHFLNFPGVPDAPSTWVGCAECMYLQIYDTGAVFWSPTSGANAMYDDSLIWKKWLEVRDLEPWMTEVEELGCLISDNVEDIDLQGTVAQYSQFKQGRIYKLGTYAVKIGGPIYEKWLALGGSKGLGLPRTDVSCRPSSHGKLCSAKFGTDKDGNPTSGIDWTENTGTHVLRGPTVKARWSGGWYFATSFAFGAAITDEQTTPDGRAKYMVFALEGENGTAAIFANDTMGFTIGGEFWETFQQRGGVNGYLQWPISDQTRRTHIDDEFHRKGYGYFQDFAGGSLYHSITGNKSFETPISLEQEPNDLQWEKRWLDANYSGNLTFSYRPLHGNARLVANFQFAAVLLNVTYTIQCALRDADGQIYRFGEDGYVTSGAVLAGSHKVIDERMSCFDWAAEVKLIEDWSVWRALLFSNPIECRFALNFTSTLKNSMQKEMYDVLKQYGPSSYILDLLTLEG